VLRPRPKLISLCLLSVLLLAACGGTASPTAAGATIAPTTQATGRPATAPVGSTATRSGTTIATRTSTAGSTPAAVIAPRLQLPVTVEDKDGRSVTISDVSRTIALTGDVAEIIWALGMRGSVIATDTSVTYLPQARKAPKIGYMRTLEAEGLLAQKPTLLIGGESAGPPEVLEQLRSSGVPVVIIASPTTLAAPAQKIREVAAAFGIPAAGEQLASTTHAEIDAALADRSYPSLSGGEQSRVSLARVLAQEAPILLLDEPTAALDLRRQQAVLVIARELASGGAAVLAVLHDLNLAAAYADRVVLLSAGRLAAIEWPWMATVQDLAG